MPCPPGLGHHRVVNHPTPALVTLRGARRLPRVLDSLPPEIIDYKGHCMVHERFKLALESLSPRAAERIAERPGFIQFRKGL